MGDSALLYTLRFWVITYLDRFKTEVAVRNDLYNALNKAKIGIPFPTQTVYVKK